MTHDDDQLRRIFAGISFAGEPPEVGFAEEDLRRARSRLRRHRAATWTSVTAGIAALGAGVAFAVPNLGTDDGNDLLAAGEADVADETGCGDTARDGDQLGFASTRQCLLEIAAKHFDPDRVHLPEKSGNAGTGGSEHGWVVSSKLDWRVPGESGLGMIQVAVSTPGYADGENAEYDVAWRIGCEDIAECTYQSVPGTGEQVLVARADPERNLLLGVMYERPDGSFAGVGVYDLFGNNSLEPVSNVAITLEQAMAFVTDPALQVDQSEIGNAELAEEFGTPKSARDWEDFLSTKVVPAPETRDMTSAEIRAVLDECISHYVDERAVRDFEPVIGVSIDSDSDHPMFMVIAQQGDKKIMCGDSGAITFGTREVKSSPYLLGKVDGETPYFGRYMSDVDRITVQLSGEPQREAVMKDGYWYLPYQELIEGRTDVALRGSVKRGYDADGNLIYDTTKKDPDACYADPDGTEIVAYGTDENPDVADCIPALEWDF